MKKFNLIQFFLILLVGVFLAWWFWSNLKQAPFRDLTKAINKATDQTYKTGTSQKVSFLIPEKTAVVLISPPYASLKQINSNFPSVLVQQIESEINSTETGHFFYINNSRIVDHRFLSNYAEPILGISKQANVIFLISKKETSGRPVRIEIVGE